MKYMVFDVGGTAIKYSVMDEDLRIYEKGEVPTPRDSREHFYQVLEEIYLPHREETEGVALSLPGFIDIENGYVDAPGAIDYNKNAYIGLDLEKRFGCPVHIANDGKCAAVAEYWKGELKGCTNGTVMILGTGIGGGLIVGGKLVNGVHFTAGEFSFLHANPDMWEDMDGMFSLRSSARGLLSYYCYSCMQRGIPEDGPLDGRIFFERYHRGDPFAAAALDRLALTAARQIYNMSVLLDLEVVAIGGGISGQDAVIEAIETRVKEAYASGPNALCGFCLTAPRIVRCHFGSEANQIGALYLYLEAEGKPLT